MSGGSQTQTQKVDPVTRQLGLNNYNRALGLAGQPFQDFNPSSINQYMSPYTQDVIDAGTTDINKQRDLTLQQNAGQQTAQHAFGGDRSAVMDALTNNDYNSQIASFDANTRNAGFNNAQNVALEDWKAKEMYPMMWQGLLNSAFGSVADTGTKTSTSTSSPNWWQMGAGLLGDAAMFAAI